LPARPVARRAGAVWLGSFSEGPGVHDVRRWAAGGVAAAGDALEWIARFRADKWTAARDFWQAMYEGMAEAFAQGMTEPPHGEHGPVKK